MMTDSERDEIYAMWGRHGSSVAAVGRDYYHDIIGQWEDKDMKLAATEFRNHLQAFIDNAQEGT